MALRCRYEHSSLLLPAAAGFAAVTLHASAERGGARHAGAAALLDQPAALQALCALAARTPRCMTSQESVGAALRACLKAVEPGAPEAARRHKALLDAGADAALEIVARNFRDAGERAKADAAAALLHKLRYHPAHPDMQVRTD